MTYLAVLAAEEQEERRMGYESGEVPFESIIGETFAKVENRDNEDVYFLREDGSGFRMHHYNDCCESVQVEDIAGDLSDLVGSPILFAEESTNSEEPKPPGDYVESFTWTFYRVGTIKGSVVIRWLGESSGYYSESVSFETVTP